MPSGMTLLPHTVGTVTAFLQKGRRDFMRICTSVRPTVTVTQTQGTAAHTFGELTPRPQALLPDRAHISTLFCISSLFLSKKVHYYISAKCYIMLLCSKSLWTVSVLSQITSSYLLHSILGHISLYRMGAGQLHIPQKFEIRFFTCLIWT